MESESKSKFVPEFIPLFFEDRLTISPRRVNKFLERCLIEDTESISKVCSAFFSSTDKVLLVVVIKKTDRSEEWKVSGLMKEAENKSRLITKRSESSKTFESKEEVETAFREKIKDLYEDINDEGFDSLFLALEALPTDTIDFGDETKENLPRKMIKTGFGRQFMAIRPVVRLIKIIKKFINDGYKLKLSPEELKNFTDILVQENFQPLSVGEWDVRLKAFEVLRILFINQFADFDSKILTRINHYLKVNRDSYKEEIKKTNEYLKDDPRDDKQELSLKASMQERVNFLHGISLFDQVQSEDLREVLELKNSLNQLNGLRNKEQALKTIMSECKNVETRSMEYIDAVNSLNELQKEMNYHSIVEDIKNALKIDDFLIEYAKANKTITYDDSIIKGLVFYSSFNNLNEKEAMAILKILTMAQNKVFDDIPEKIMKAINDNKNHMDIIEFGLKKTLSKPENFSDFMMKILVKNGDRRTHLKVLKVCRKYEDHLDAYNEKVFDIEEGIFDKLAYIDLQKVIRMQDRLMILNKIEKLINTNQEITQNMFKFFKYCMDIEEVHSLMKKILRNNRQPLPKFLIDQLIMWLNKKNDVSDIVAKSLDVVTLLVKRRLLNCSDIEKFLKMVFKNDSYQKAALFIVYYANESGQEISKNLLDYIKEIKFETGNSNLATIIKDPGSKKLVLIDPKLDSEEKLEYLKELVEADFSPEIVKTLLDFIKYDDKLNIEALNALVEISPEALDPVEHNINVVDTIKWVLNANLTNKILQKLLKKTNINIERVYPSLNKSENEKLQHVIKKRSIKELDSENIDEFYNFLNHKLNKKEWISEGEINTLIVGLTNDNMEEKIIKISQLLLKISQIQPFPDFCYTNLKNILQTFQNYKAKEILQKILIEKDQKAVESIRIRTGKNLRDSIKGLKADFNNKKAEELVISLNGNITSSNIEEVKSLCLMDKLSVKIKASLWKNLSKNIDMIKDDVEFSYKMFKNVTQNLDTNLTNQLKIRFEEMSKQPNKIELKFRLINAIMYAEIHGATIKSTYLTNPVVKFIPRDIMIQVMYTKVTCDKEYEIQDVINSLDEFENIFSGELKTDDGTNDSITGHIPVEDMISSILDKLIDKQVTANDLNDILIIFCSSENSFTKFTTNNDRWSIIVPSLRKDWLTERLKQVYKVIDEDVIEKLMIMLDFNLSLLKILLKETNNLIIEPKELLKYFEFLKQNSLLQNERENILKDFQTVLCSEWLSTVEENLTNYLLKKHLSSFSSSDDGYSNLENELKNLFHIGWSEKGLIELLQRIRSREDLKQISSPMRLIYEFNLKEFTQNLSDERVIDIFNKYGLVDVQKKIYELCIYNSFKGTREKEDELLKEEILSLNDSSSIKYLQSSDYYKEYKEIMKTITESSSIAPDLKPIKEWNKNDLMIWTKRFRPNLFSKKSESIKSNLFSGPAVSKAEFIAVLMQAIKIDQNHWPRTIQIFSLLFLLNPVEIKGHALGRLMQINTGEGKSDIVAMLATIKALEGHEVDVVTSSSELAKPQLKDFENFYAMFGLTSSHNSEDKVDKRTRYKANIVYGAAGDFQADILREEYSKMSIKSGRKCDLVIVDEADSMLIDGRNFIVMLSSQMPGMNNLEPILACIWTMLGQFANEIKEERGKFYYVKKNVELDAEGTPKKLGQYEKIEINLNEFVKKNLLKQIKDYLEGKVETLDLDKAFDLTSKESRLKMPSHLREFIIDHQLERWIDSAIYAKFHSTEYKNYIVEDKTDKIIPVDADNTGVLQQSMNWSNGLHQFLQLKHGTKITPESITTNYISNISYFKRYGSNIFGMTGTLGSRRSRDLIQEVYNLDSIIIPPFKVKRFKELSPVVTSNEKSWYDEIVTSNLRHLKNKRAVLIITKYIKDANELQRRFEIEHDKSKVRVYKTDQESEVVKEKVNSGDIIIATNIAGRGTDIKTQANVEDHGGLHVCVTFLPPNERVEYQNIGRTSRTGNRGTAQFIVFDKENRKCFKKLKANRDVLEEKEIKAAKDQIDKTLIKDNVFKEFCELLTNTNNDFERRSIEERFGIWLQMQSKETDLNEEYQKFKREIMNDLNDGNVIKNPCYHILQGNKHLDKEHYEEAINNYKKAIELDEEFSENAYYNRAYAKLKLYCNDVANNKDKIQEAIDDFKECRKRIKNRETELHLIKKASTRKENMLKEKHADQVERKGFIYAIQKNAIDFAIGCDQESYDQKVCDYEKHGENPELDATTRKPKLGEIGKALEKGQNIEIVELEIRKSFPKEQDVKLLNDEIEEFSANGFRGTFVIKYNQPISWGQFFVVLSIGVGQVVLGVSEVIFMAGAINTSSNFFTDGFSDIINAVKSCLIDRNFSWKEYVNNHALSLLTNIQTFGLNAIKAAVESLNLVSGEVAKADLSLTFQKVGLSALEYFTKKGSKYLANKVLDITILKGLKNIIFEAIIETVQSILKSINVIARMLAVDAWRKNPNFQGKIIKIMEEEIFNDKDGWNRIYDYGFKRLKDKNKQTDINEDFKKIGIECIKMIDQSKLEKVLEKTFSKELEAEEKEMIESIEEDNVQAVNVTEEVINGVAEQLSNKITSSIADNIIRPYTNEALDGFADFAFGQFQTNLDAQLESFAKDEIKSVKVKREIKREPKKSIKINEEQRKKAKDNIDKFEKGGAPGSEHLDSIADAIDRQLKVVDENEDIISIHGYKNGESPVVVQLHSDGFYTKPGDSRAGSFKDSLFNVIASNSDKDPVKMRKDAADQMEKNLDFHASKLIDKDRLNHLIGNIKMRKKRNAQRILRLESGPF